MLRFFKSCFGNTESEEAAALTQASQTKSYTTVEKEIKIPTSSSSVSSSPIKTPVKTIQVDLNKAQFSSGSVDIKKEKLDLGSIDALSDSDEASDNQAGIQLDDDDLGEYQEFNKNSF